MSLYNMIEYNTLQRVIKISSTIALYDIESDLYSDSKFISFVINGWI